MSQKSLKKPHILLLNGPNLNLLGTREPDVYGTTSLADVEARLQQQAENLGVLLVTNQSNAEHELIDWVHSAKRDGVDFIIINPAAYTHTSIALHDALAAVAIPFIEVHLSNIYARESFRHHSYISPLAQGVICGLGTTGYELALTAAVSSINSL